MESEMTRSEEAIWKYLVEHKRPVMAGTLAKRFILSQSHVTSVLKKLVDQGIADRTRVGKHYFYRIKN
jgi:predicted transcriptional regulator